MTSAPTTATSEIVEVKGHIIDSLILPKILDQIIDANGSFEILDITIGKRKSDASRARLKITAANPTRLRQILRRISALGATPVDAVDVTLRRATKPGVFPEGFYSTTNLPTQIRYRARWRAVERIEMDCGIVVEPRSGRAVCTPMHRIRRGNLVVCGGAGVKVTPLERSRQREIFQFMSSTVSSEKPKGRIIAELAEEMRRIKRDGRKILVVAGPAVVHTGAAPYLAQIIKAGYVDVLFAGNGLATHDLELNLYGTSLGAKLDASERSEAGHDHHLRTINAIRAVGGIRQAVRRGLVKHGIMHACVKRNIPFVLCGSIRDDGPLPDVITDVVAAQDAMRRHIPGLGLALMVASTLHTIATGNILPATVKTVCVDINPAVVTKVADRGSFQIVGLVTDSESFLRELARCLRP